MPASIATRSRGQEPELASTHFTVSFRRDFLAPLLSKATPTGRRELQSLEREGDPQLFFETLISFAGRQERADRLELASQIYGAVAQSELPSLPALRQARERLDAILGQGAIGNQVGVLARRFTREAFHPSSLVGMIGAQAVFGIARAAFLSRLIAQPSAGFFTRGLGARTLAAGGAFALEVPSFSAFTRLANTALAAPQDWSASALGRELASGFLTLGSMKVLGRLPLHEAGLLGGIVLGHRLEEWAGLRESQSGANIWLSSLAMLLQFKVAGRVINGALGPKWESFQRELLWRSQSGGGGGHSVNLDPRLVTAGAPLEILQNHSSKPSLPSTERLFMTGEGNGSPKEPTLLERWLNLMAEAKERGQESELRTLRDLVLQLNQGQSVDWLNSFSGVPVKSWLGSEDPRLWRNALPSIAETIERCPGFLRLLESSEPAQLFLKQWGERPHYADLKQVPVELVDYKGDRGQAQRWLRNLRKAIAQNGTLEGWRTFAKDRRANGEVLEFEETPHAQGRLVLATWQNMRIRLSFDTRGHFFSSVQVLPVPKAQVRSVELIPVWRKLIDSVEQKGSSSDLRTFKDLILQTFTAENGASLGEKTARRLNSQDPQDWHTGLRVLSGMLESYSTLPSPQAAPRDLASFLDRWQADSRFLEFQPTTTPTPRPLKQPFSWTPPAPTPALSPNVAPVSATPAAPRSQSAPKNSQGFGPKPEESAVEWALRLDYQSRNGSDPLRILEELTDRLNHPEKRASTLEMIRVLRAVTAHYSGTRIEVRYRGAPGFAEVLTLTGLPASYLGEAWPWTFAETLVTNMKAEATAPKRILEINAGSGGLSVALAKWGLAKEAVALDPDPNARIVGNFNLALNEMPNGVRFENDKTLEFLPDMYKADLIFASFPKGPVLDSDGLSHMSGVLAQTHSKLAPGGKLFLNVAGYPGIQSLSTILQRRGYQPVVKQSEWVPQPPGIDMNRLAKWEQDAQIRLEFFRKGEPGIPISLKAASKTPEIGYQRYLIEGTPILAAKETSPNDE